jgi:membrane-bound serine protease (ClpP class)
VRTLATARLPTQPRGRGCDRRGAPGPDRPGQARPGASGGRRRRLIAAGLVLSAIGVLVAPSALAGAGAEAAPDAHDAPGAAAPDDVGVVSVVTINGFIDPVLAALMNQSIDDANRVGAVALVFQTDLQGSVLPGEQLGALVTTMSRSTVPVDLWIGPSGSELSGAATALIFGADKVAMAPGTRIGDLPVPADREPATLARYPWADPQVASTWRRTDLAVSTVQGRSLDAKQAEEAKVAAFAPTLGEFFLSVPGVESKEVTKNGQTGREPVTRVVFSQLSLLDGFMHSAASPAVAYFMLTVGLTLFIFELFTAGVGVAGVIGAFSFVLAGYGLAVLPIHWWGLALIVGAMIAFAVDVQTGVPRFWTGSGLVLFALGTLTLYDGVSMSWLTMAVALIGVALSFLAGMPSMVRARFSTPTIGREWMIGEIGRAITDINPDGVVQIQDAPWRAYTNRATPIDQLDRVRVTGIEGLVLEVEPETGAARDYRERRPEAPEVDA